MKQSSLIKKLIFIYNNLLLFQTRVRL